MNEADWRARLVRSFNDIFKDRGFIWVNDVRYKAGFPDLYVVLDGRCAHYELKLCKGQFYKDQQSALQAAVCKRLARAGVHVSCLTYVPYLEIVHVRNFNGYGTPNEFIMPVQEFNEQWVNGHQI